MKRDPASCPVRKSIKAFDVLADADSAPVPPLNCAMLCFGEASDCDRRGGLITPT